MNILVVHNGYRSRNIGGEDVAVQKEILALRRFSNLKVHEYFVSNDNLKLGALAKNIWGDRFHANEITRIIRENQIQLVHVHNFFPLLTPLIFRAAKKAGCKVVHTLHNYRWWCLSGTLFRKNQSCEQCLSKKFALPGVIHGCYRDSRVQSLVAGSAFAWYQHQHFLDDIDQFFVLSEFAKEKLAKLLPAHKLKVKPHLIEEPTNLTLNTEEKQDYLFVGRLEAGKGIDLLCEHWKKLGSEFRLKVVGTSDQFDSYKARYESDQIRFLGKKSHAETLNYMRAARFLIQPSLAYETFGLTILEAMSVGTPVIALDIGPRKELVRHQFNGILTTPQQLETTLINTRHNYDYEELSQNAFNFAKYFYPQSIIEKQISFYNQI